MNRNSNLLQSKSPRSLWLALSSLILGLLLTTVPTSSLAQPGGEIIIQDTLGVTRATGQVTDLGQIEFSLIDSAGQAADGVDVVLTNVATGESISMTAANGTVLFESVAPGVWTVASPAAGVTFTSVAVNPMIVGLAIGGAAGLSTAGVAVLGGAAVAGSVVAIDESTRSNSGSGQPLSPSS